MRIEMSATIGLEVHVQLTALKTKLFCGCSSEFRGKAPNTVVCPTCLGFPGALPVLNKRAVDMALMVAIALGCKKIHGKIAFSRKHYFYPDLPKNYQISQHDKYGLFPLAEEGFLTLSNGRIVRIRRVHLEEDPGRIIHFGGPIGSALYELIDYNRSGIALVEIVTEPDITSSSEAREFLNVLRSIIEHLGISDLSLEGALRCDANISIKNNPRVEIKNISSFKGVERALTYEINRQQMLIKMGQPVERETRHWDEEREITFGLREKEELADYRYMPEGDLPPIEIDEDYIERVRQSMPELPQARIKRLMHQYGLSQYTASVLVGDKQIADFYERAASYAEGRKIEGFYVRLANLLSTDVVGYLEMIGKRINDVAMKPESFAKLITLELKSEITVRAAKNLIPEVISGADPEALANERGLLMIKDESVIKSIVDEVIRENVSALRDALDNPKAKEYIIGQVIRKTNARADIQITRRLVEKAIEQARKNFE